MKLEFDFMYKEKADAFLLKFPAFEAVILKLAESLKAGPLAENEDNSK